MALITFAQLRYRVSEALMQKFTDLFSELYQNSSVKYPEESMPELMVATREQTITFLHEIIKSNDQTNLDNLYKKTDPKIICCFYLRYWLLINALEPLSHSDDNKISVPDDAEGMLKFLLFEFIEDQSNHQ